MSFLLALNVPPLDAGPTKEGCDKGLLAAGLSSSPELDFRDEIIQELGRSVLLHGASTELMTTIWSCGDTLPDEDVLGILVGLNDKKL